MAEFVDGFNFLANLERTVTFFGSARLPQDHPASEKARELARLLTEAGCTVITGGGPGIMEAANHGAKEAGGESIGLNIELPLEQRVNQHVTSGVGFHHFFTRKVMFAYSAEAFVFFPGGLGTLDEFFELATLLQTKKMEEQVPIILVGRDYWEPLLEWVDKTVYTEFKAIDARDQKLWTLTDSVEEAYTLVRRALPRKRLRLHHS